MTIMYAILTLLAGFGMLTLGWFGAMNAKQHDQLGLFLFCTLIYIGSVFPLIIGAVLLSAKLHLS